MTITDEVLDELAIYTGGATDADEFRDMLANGTLGEYLDGLVHDVFSQQASRVNNSGVEAQITVLLDRSDR